MASRLIFMKIFLLSPMFSKEYENLLCETITTRAQKRIQQEKAKYLNQNEIQEKLDKHFSSKPLVKKPRGRPRKNLLTNLKNIPSQSKRKRGRPRKQIYEDELPERNMQKGSRTKVESDSDSDFDISDYLKQTQARNRKTRMPRRQKILMNLKVKKVKIVFQLQKMKSTKLKPHTKEIMKEIMKEILKKVLKMILKKILKRISNRILKTILKTILREILKKSLKKTKKKTWKKNSKSLILRKI